MTESDTGPLSRLAPSFVRRSYTVKFMVSILLVVVVVASVGTVGFVDARETVREDAEGRLASTAEVQSGQLGDFLREERSRTARLASSSAVATGETAAVQSVVGDRLERYGAAEIHVIDLEAGTIHASTVAGRLSLDGVDQPWADLSTYESMGPLETRTLDDGVESVAQGGAVSVATVSTTERGDRAVVLVSRLGGVDGPMTGLAQPADSGATALVSDGGAVVAGARTYEGRTTVNASGTAALGGSDPTAFATGGEEPIVRAGDARLYASDRIEVGPDATWTVVTSVPTAEAFAVVDSVGRSVGAIIALSLLSLGLVALVLGRQTVTPLSRLRRKVERMEEGDLDVDLRSGRVDEVGQLYAGFASMRDSLQDRIREIEETNRRLERSAEEYSAVMRACADGDLTRRMDPDAENDSMAAIAREFNTMIEELEATTERIREFAYEVSISSQEVTASASLVRDSSEQVTDSVLDISEGADRQNESLADVSADLERLSETTDEIASSSSEVATVARRTAETGREGQEAAQAAVADMDRVVDESEEAVEEIQRLERETEQIDELLAFIDEIAQRTNMLALNANIEANRTSEGGGRSFGVIANEIKQLSEEVQTATEDIEERLERIQSQTGDAAEVVGATSRAVQSSAENVREAVDALEVIAEQAETTNRGVQSIREATEAQVESTTEVAREVEAVAEISTRTSSEAETVARLAREQSAATGRMSDSANGLNERALRLSETLDDFETDAGVSDDGEAGRGADVGDASGGGGGDGDEDAVFSPMADADDPASFDPSEAEGDVGTDAVFSPDALAEEADAGGDRNGDGAASSTGAGFGSDSGTGSGSEPPAEADEDGEDAEAPAFGFDGEEDGR
jgi:methyl-accepting chemotaxis protein